MAGERMLESVGGEVQSGVAGGADGAEPGPGAGGAAGETDYYEIGVARVRAAMVSVAATEAGKVPTLPPAQWISFTPKEVRGQKAKETKKLALQSLTPAELAAELHRRELAVSEAGAEAGAEAGE